MRSRFEPNRRGRSVKKTLRQFFPFCWHDVFVLVGVLTCAMLLCHVLRMIDESDVFVALVFELAVVMVSRFTNGYLFGLLASVLGVIGVNYIFTYPFYELNFTISGYPLTFLVMLVVSVTVSTLTTQIKRQEQLRAEAEKEKARSNLLRAVSHDIRTPLTGIAGCITTLLDSGDSLTDGTREELLTNVRDEANWLIGVVENLLSVTRISGDSHLRKELEAGEEVLSAAAMKLQKVYPKLSVKVRAPQELLMIPMDAILIQQVLINLMENAARHGITTTCVELSLRSEGKFAIFEVADNGQGIPRELLSHIFSAETHSATSTGEADGKRNMGIGLSVCMTIVQAHGGTMLAENRPEGGALFQFTLPLEANRYDNERKNSDR